jgi:pyruvate,orthophosphate dikinase
MGKVCVCGAAALQIDYAAKTSRWPARLQGRRLPLHRRHAGNVYAGQLPRPPPSEIVQVLVEKAAAGRARVHQNFAS